MNVDDFKKKFSITGGKVLSRSRNKYSVFVIELSSPSPLERVKTPNTM